MEPTGIPEVEPNGPNGASDSGAETPLALPRKKNGGGLSETLSSLLIILIGVFCIRIFIGEATVIPTGSMEDTILVGDHVFLDKLPYGPQIPYTPLRLPSIKAVHRGDIVAFHYPRNPSLMYVKRVIGMGGDVIRIVNDQVYRNGERLNEPYAVYSSNGVSEFSENFPPSPDEFDEVDNLVSEGAVDPAWARAMPEYIRPNGLRVPKGYFFVMGDNRDDSSDSRFWGFVPAKNVVGEPLFVYWSYNAPSSEWLDETLEGRLRFDESIIANFLHNTRWKRIGKVFENPNVK
ncbi:MAG: signal peptidase I [Terriglobia bacterium]